jgi:hypothetical protein
MDQPPADAGGTGAALSQSNAAGGRQVIAATIVTFAVLAIVFWQVLPSFADYGQAWGLIRRMPVAGLVALAATILVNVLVFPWPLQAALPGLSYSAAFVVRQTSFMISNTVPGGGAISLAVQYSVLADAGVKTARATAAITLTGLWNLLIMLALPAFGAAVLLGSGHLTPEWLVAAGVSFVGIAALIALLAAALRDEGTARRVGERSDRLIARVLRMFGEARGPRFGDQLVAVRTATVDTLRTRRLPLTISSLSLHLVQFAILVVTLRALQGSAPASVTMPEALAAIAFARLATFVPVTPNGLGTVDAGLTGLLIAFGAAGDEALASVLVWRVATTLPQVAIGSATFLYWRHRRMHLRARAPSDDPVTGHDAT